MSEQEKELTNLIISLYPTYHWDGTNVSAIAQAIISAGYVKAEKVWEGESLDADDSLLGAGVAVRKMSKTNKHIQVFVREITKMVKNV